MILRLIVFLLLNELSNSLVSDTLYLSSTKKASYYEKSNKDGLFLLEQNLINQFYKIEIEKSKTAKLFERSNSNEDYKLIFPDSSLVFDVMSVNSGEINRIVFINFDDKENGIRKTFKIEIKKSGSSFTLSDGGYNVNQIVCGDVAKPIDSPALKNSEIINFNRNQLFAYAYGASKNTISESDAKKIIKITGLISDWNSIASQFVIISKKFVSGNQIVESDISTIDDGVKSLFKIKIDMESNFENIDDDGVFMFFREIHKLYNEMSLEYALLKNSILLKNFKDYDSHSKNLVELAVLKSQTLKPFSVRLNSINASGVNSEFQDFFKKWSVPQGVKQETKKPIVSTKIKVGNKTVDISGDNWDIVNSESEYSINLIKNIKRKNEKSNQIVTIFNIEMTNDRKKGAKVSENIYLEAFNALENSITIQIRINKGNYWVLSRQTFENNNNKILSSGEYADESKVAIISNLFQDEISNTINLINSTF
jgi:hypothetical protein